MKALIGAAAVVAVLTVGVPVASAATATPQPKAQTAALPAATDFSARRYHRRSDGYRRYPSYYARPRYYRPYPYYVLAPFAFGIGFGPFWW